MPRLEGIKQVKLFNFKDVLPINEKPFFITFYFLDNSQVHQFLILGDYNKAFVFKIF